MNSIEEVTKKINCQAITDCIVMTAARKYDMMAKVEENGVCIVSSSTFPKKSTLMVSFQVLMKHGRSLLHWKRATRRKYPLVRFLKDFTIDDVYSNIDRDLRDVSCSTGSFKVMDAKEGIEYVITSC